MGKMPKKPAANSPAKEKGRYALFMMLLFRSWRGTTTIDFLHRLLGVSKIGLTEDNAWERIYADYVLWRKKEIDDKACGYELGIEPSKSIGWNAVYC